MGIVPHKSIVCSVEPLKETGLSEDGHDGVYAPVEGKALACYISKLLDRNEDDHPADSLDYEVVINNIHDTWPQVTTGVHVFLCWGDTIQRNLFFGEDKYIFQ